MWEGKAGAETRGMGVYNGIYMYIDPDIFGQKLAKFVKKLSLELMRDMRDLRDLRDLRSR